MDLFRSQISSNSEKAELVCFHLVPSGFRIHFEPWGPGENLFLNSFPKLRNKKKVCVLHRYIGREFGKLKYLIVEPHSLIKMSCWINLSDFNSVRAPCFKILIQIHLPIFNFSVFKTREKKTCDTENLWNFFFSQNVIRFGWNFACS